MTELAVAHRFGGAAESDAKYGPQWQATCTGCDWKGDRLWEEKDMVADYERHIRLVKGLKGIYECGCSPTDAHPLNWSRKPLGRRKQCPVHRKAYMPKNPPKPSAKPLVSTREILDALKAKYTGGEWDRHAPWAYFEELRVDTAWSGHGSSRRAKMRQLHDSKGNPRVDDLGRPVMKMVHHSQQGLDAFAMAMWAGKGFERICYEVKVTRADFLNEITKPWKREIGMEVSNRFFYITPPGLLKVEEIPDGCGLQEVHPSGHIRTVLKAPSRNTDERSLPMSFTVSMLRQFNKRVSLDG